MSRRHSPATGKRYPLRVVCGVAGAAVERVRRRPRRGCETRREAGAEDRAE